MNKLSLLHNAVQNQASTIDDMLGFNLNRTFAGSGTMSHKKTLTDYAERLAYEYGKYEDLSYHLRFRSLPMEEKNTLVQLFMEAHDRDTSECVYGDDFSINSDYTCALLAMLKNDCKRTREHFAEITRLNTIKYYSDALQDILDEACYFLSNSLMENKGLHASYDRDHGDVVWGKF